MLTRIEGGDLTALDAKYYLACLTIFRNRHRSLLRQNPGSDSSLQEIERAFVELITHVKNGLEDGIFCFKFLHSELYQNHRSSLGLKGDQQSSIQITSFGVFFKCLTAI